MVDWSVTKKAFVLDNRGEQFRNSAYVQFLNKAAAFLKNSKYASYAALLEEYAKTKYIKEAFGNRGGEIMPLN